MCYGRDDEQQPLKSFTPELSFPQSSLDLILEGKQTAGLKTHCMEVDTKKQKTKQSAFLFFIIIGRWTPPFSEQAEDPVCEHPEDGPAGEEASDIFIDVLQRSVWL